MLCVSENVVQRKCHVLSNRQQQWYDNVRNKMLIGEYIFLIVNE